MDVRVLSPFFNVFLLLFSDIVKENLLLTQHFLHLHHTQPYICKLHILSVFSELLSQILHTLKKNKALLTESVTFILFSDFSYLNPFVFRYTVNMKLSYTDAINLSSASFFKTGLLEVGRRTVSVTGKHP